MTTLGPLWIREASEGGIRRLTPVGELDLATAPLLERAFDVILESEDAAMIVVDLTELNFMDSTGVRLLLRMHAACEGADRLRVVNGSRSVERLLELAGARAHLPMISRHADPLATLRR